MEKKGPSNTRVVLKETEAGPFLPSPRDALSSVDEPSGHRYDPGFMLSKPNTPCAGHFPVIHMISLHWLPHSPPAAVLGAEAQLGPTVCLRPGSLQVAETGSEPGLAEPRVLSDSKPVQAPHASLVSYRPWL